MITSKLSRLKAVPIHSEESLNTLGNVLMKILMLQKDHSYDIGGCFAKCQGQGTADSVHMGRFLPFITDQNATFCRKILYFHLRMAIWNHK